MQSISGDTKSVYELSPRTRCIEAMEESTQRDIVIAFTEYEADGKFNEQEASPLFSMLPRELRDLIWAYATAPFEDTNSPFEKTAYYYRPGHTARLETDFSLLLTCRRIWLEANAMPMLQAEHSYYFDRPAPDRRTPEWMGKLTDHNRQNFGHLHMFVQMCNIEGLTDQPGRLRKYFLGHLPLSVDFQPRLLHVTLRHTDWWYWENEEPLRLLDSWVQALLNTPDLRSTETLKLEMETLDYKVPQLQPIVERIQGMKSDEKGTHYLDSRVLKSKFVLTGAPEIHDWEGPSNINKESYQPYAQRDTLKYHVVTLTWKLRFPDIPGAFVPTLRRAPRTRQLGPGLGMDTAVPHPRSTQALPPWQQQQPPLMYQAETGLRSPRRLHLLGVRQRAVMAQGLVRGGKSVFSEWKRLEHRIRFNSRQQADDVEVWRRRQFLTSFSRDRREYWAKRWLKEKSLLRFTL